MSGKGDRQRPVNRSKYGRNFDIAFKRVVVPPPKVEIDAKKQANKDKCRKKL
jgi:hypothetical protein